MLELPRFRAELFGLALLIGLTLATLAWLGLPSLLRAPWTGLPATTVALASEMVLALVFLMPLGVIISLFSAWMLAAGRHANTLLEGVPALAIALAVLMLPGGGIEPLVWGTLAGFAFHLTSLAIPLARRGEIEAPRFARQSPHWSPFWQSFGIMLAGQALMSLVGIIDQFFAAYLGTGAIATLSYANRILALILGLGATAVSRATLPIFSKAEAQGSAQGHRLASHWVRFLFNVRRGRSDHWLGARTVGGTLVVRARRFHCGRYVSGIGSPARRSAAITFLLRRTCAGIGPC